MSQQPRHLAEQNFSTRTLEALAREFPGLFQPAPGAHNIFSRRTA